MIKDSLNFNKLNNKHHGGRPSKYKSIYCKRIIKYFDIAPNTVKKERFYYKNGDIKEKEVEVAGNLPTIEGFSREININKSTLHEWIRHHKEFSNAYNWAKELQENIWLQNGLKGLYNASFAIFAGKNMFGWRDKTETDLSTKQEPLIIKVLSFNKK